MPETPNPLPIGLFDSGLGGLTVLRELKRVLPHENYIYLGDTARTPYGSKTPETIVRYSRECLHFLQRQEIKLLVVACNTASALALKVLEAEAPFPVIGTIEPAVSAALETSSGRIGVIGTQATIASAVYEDRLRELDAAAHVYSQACPLFVPLVESGMLAGEIVDKVIELYLTPLRDQKIDTLILGCTHYPLLHEAISDFLGPNINVIECSQAITQTISKLFPDTNEVTQDGVTKYFTTDCISRFNHLATALLNGSVVNAVRVEELVA